MSGLFGPTLTDAWTQLAQRTGADIEAGNWLRNMMLVYAHGNWEIKLDTFAVTTGTATTPYTRLRAPYTSLDGFEFKLTRTHMFHKLADAFGMEDIATGDSTFDEAFRIKGSSEQQVRSLLTEDIKASMHHQPTMWYEVQHKRRAFKQPLPDDARILYYHTVGLLRDVDRLEGLFNLFTLTLDRLVDIGSASPDNPGVSVRRQ